MLINERNGVVLSIHGESKKIKRMEHSNAAVKITALQTMFDTNMFTKERVKQMNAKGAKGMQCIALMDNQVLSSHIHHLDVKVDRLQANMSELEKSLKQKKTTQETKRAELHDSHFCTECYRGGLLL